MPLKVVPMPHFPATPNAPKAAKQPVTQTVHGVTLHDDYHWLRAENWQEAMRDPDKLPTDIATYLLGALHLRQPLSQRR